MFLTWPASFRKFARFLSQIVWLLVPSEVTFGAMFAPACEKLGFLVKRQAPSIFEYFTQFWLDFEGLGRPQTTTDQAKVSTAVCIVLALEKPAPEVILARLRGPFETIF